ncbi:hypothetical protein ABDK96_15810 [Citricoccus nitrophenolicus]|uniref:Uncharacterized protein n=1 Tax=Citricoccus nitrophenolicus TaxID=863575 RepID=A0ABV0ILV0_9MICC
MTDKAHGIRNAQVDDEASEESGRHSRRILVEFDADADDAQDLAMAIWYTAQASKVTDFWVLPTFEMRPGDDWNGPDDVEVVVRKKHRR